MKDYIIRIIQNAVKILEKDCEYPYLVSTHTHDFNTYTFKDGNSISVDGGHSYIRRAGNVLNNNFYYKDWSLDTSSTIPQIAEKLLWGSYGKDGLDVLHYILLKDAETSHLKSILKTQKQISDIYKQTIKYILKMRKK